MELLGKRQSNRMVGVQIRLPREIRQKAKQFADSISSGDERVTESDVYRHAIILFLDRNSTDSRDENLNG